MNNIKQKEKNIPTYMRLSFRIFIILLLFCILTYEVLTLWTFVMDESVYTRIMNTFAPNFTEFFRAFTNIWSTYWVIIVALIITSIFAFKKGYRKYAILTFSTPIIIYLLNTIIKNIIQRPRPDILRLITETWYSYPSWHTMHAVALYWLIIILSYFFIKNKTMKFIISIVSLLMILCIATSRIYLWVHYFSDVLWWLLLSLLYLCIIKNIFFTKKAAQ